MLTKQPYQIISIAILLITAWTYQSFAQQSDGKFESTKIGKFHSSIKTSYNLNTYENESPLGFEMTIGLNLNQYNAITVGLIRYEVYAHGDTTFYENGVSIVGPGGIGYFMLGLNYEHGLGSLTQNTFLKKLFINGGIYIVDYKESLFCVSLSPEYKIPISKSFSIPIGLKFIWPINTVEDTNIAKWDFIGLHAGIAFN